MPSLGKSNLTFLQNDFTKEIFHMNISFPFYCSSIYSILITLKARQPSLQHKRHVALLFGISYTVFWDHKKKKKKIILTYRREKCKAWRGRSVWLAGSSEVARGIGSGSSTSPPFVPHLSLSFTNTQLDHHNVFWERTSHRKNITQALGGKKEKNGPSDLK